MTEADLSEAVAFAADAVAQAERVLKQTMTFEACEASVAKYMNNPGYDKYAVMAGARLGAMKFNESCIADAAAALADARAALKAIGV